MEIQSIVHELAEEQIKTQQRVTDHRLHEYPIDVLIEKFTKKDNSGNTEFFIPDYQRKLVWSILQQSRFIESILIDIPIPYLFGADTDEKGKEGCIEIIDGTQRLRTLVNFYSGVLALDKLEKLTELNGARFSDLSPARQRRFLRTSLRMIVLREQATEETRRDLFERLNSGGSKLAPIEILRGSIKGPLIDLIKECSHNEVLAEICPISAKQSLRFEYEERTLRFFAYSNNYRNFDHRVDEFLKSYAKNNKDIAKIDSKKMKDEFEASLLFIKNNFANGFKRNHADNNVPRVRYEALIVGTALALRDGGQLHPALIIDWLDNEEFKRLTRSDASNNRDRVLDRFEFVRDNLLNKPFVSNNKARRA